MSFAACLGGQKLLEYAQHKYRKEDSGKLLEHRREGSLRLSRRKSTERVSSFNTVQTHVQQRISGIGWRTAAFTTNPQGFPQQHSDNNLSIETAFVLLLSNTRYHRRIIVTRPRKSFSVRGLINQHQYSRYGELRDSNGAQWEEFGST